ncbi:MAG: RluA family pseudouridine synthase, partial [Rhodospirillaceae bacterium]
MTSPLKTQHTFLVGPESSGERLDKWLAAELPEISRSRVKSLVVAGAVEVDGIPQFEPACRLKGGQSIAVKIPPSTAATPQAQKLDLEILFEDEYLIVVDKPPGLVVHPAPGNPDHTLVNALLAHCGDSLQGIGGVLRPGIVHRIDKDTSGLLVAAKTEKAHAGLASQFAAHTIERSYDALVYGVPTPSAGSLSGSIGRSRFNRKKMAVVARGGKAAETLYRTVTVFGTVASHLRCTLTTGRTHQIRVHITHLGHPLIGDRTYGGAKNKVLRSLNAEAAAAIQTFPRQALHAATLGFTHPISEQALNFTRDMPADMA